MHRPIFFYSVKCLCVLLCALNKPKYYSKYISFLPKESESTLEAVIMKRYSRVLAQQYARQSYMNAPKGLAHSQQVPAEKEKRAEPSTSMRVKLVQSKYCERKSLSAKEPKKAVSPSESKSGEKAKELYKHLLKKMEQRTATQSCVASSATASGQAPANDAQCPTGGEFASTLALNKGKSDEKFATQESNRECLVAEQKSNDNLEGSSPSKEDPSKNLMDLDIEFSISVGSDCEDTKVSCQDADDGTQSTHVDDVGHEPLKEGPCSTTKKLHRKSVVNTQGTCAERDEKKPSGEEAVTVTGDACRQDRAKASQNSCAVIRISAHELVSQAQDSCVERLSLQNRGELSLGDKCPQEADSSSHAPCVEKVGHGDCGDLSLRDNCPQKAASNSLCRWEEREIHRNHGEFSGIASNICRPSITHAEGLCERSLMECSDAVLYRPGPEGIYNPKVTWADKGKPFVKKLKSDQSTVKGQSRTSGGLGGKYTNQNLINKYVHTLESKYSEETARERQLKLQKVLLKFKNSAKGIA